MKISEKYPDKWLKANHLAGSTRGVTVETSTDEELYNTQEKKKEWKVVLRFHGKKLPLILNKTQTITMKKITGEDDSADWIGHQINLSPAWTPNGSETITITAPERKAPPAPTPSEEPAAAAPPAPTPAEEPAE